MDANKMKTDFLVKLDIVTSNSAPGLTDEEIGIFLTDAEFKFVKNMLPPDGNFDNRELEKAELRPLYKLNESLTLSSEQTGIETNGKYWDLPSTCYVITRASATMSSSTTCLNGKKVSANPVRLDELNSNMGNPFKKPGKQLVWYVQGESKSDGTQRVQTIHSDDFTDITSFNLSYIKKPEGIVPYLLATTDGTTAAQIDSLLPDITHQEIVDMAVELAKLQLGLLNEYQAQDSYNDEENK